MEADLGYDLFMRTTKDIKITEKGIQFYKYATQLVQEYRSTVEKMYDLNITSEPRIKMGILESTSQWIAKVTQIHHKVFQINNIVCMKFTIEAILLISYLISMYILR